MQISIAKTLVSSANKILLLLFLISCLFAQVTGAVEIDDALFNDDEKLRQQAYHQIGRHISDKLKNTKDEKEMQHLLLQQELLLKLKELPDIGETSSKDVGFSETLSAEKIDWQTLEKYMQTYIGVIREERLSSQILEGTKKQKQKLYSRLIALPEKSEEETKIQLQHAYQVRKLKHQSVLDKQLKGRLKKAKEIYPEILVKVNVDAKDISIQQEKVKQAVNARQHLTEEKSLASASDEAEIEQQESLLAGYLGRELSDNDKKTMHYEQLKLLKLQAKKLSRESQVFNAQLEALAEEQELLWLKLLNRAGGYFQLADISGDISKKVSLLRKRAAKAQVRKYTFEKELSFLRGGNALIGPKSNELIEELDNHLSEIFTLLSGIYQRAGVLEQKGRLLDETIDLKQSSLGSMVTKTREATDDIYEKAIHVLQYPLVSYSGMTLNLLLVLQILLLLIFGIIINRLYGHVVLRMGRKRKWSERTIQLVHAMGKYPFIFIVAMILLSVIGINTSSLALVAGALSVGIGFGMQTIVNNLVSGILLLFDKSIRPGDFISLGDPTQKGGYRGNVVQMNTRSTVLRTNDNINIIIPNADLMASQVVNWTYSDEKIRFRVPFSVAYGTDIELVKSVVKQAVVDLPVVLGYPEPQIWLVEHAESSLSFVAAIWVEGQNARRPAYTFDIVLSEIYKKLDNNNIEIPFPQVDLRLRDGRKPHTNQHNTTESMFQDYRN